ncbi:PepSY domain-containing protein [Parahaliea maris]|uniref:PepSY domain-containing protein n=1 Tax=Parahaliea maris TaxID=2716870 RepID=A0A5C9A5G1_9GAMM|nr:PepSY-associated TM helix domain-containing protein [Parahaliea maris]TXS95976.1 PepSY domain-containing protein [Parahaliea maris]
MKFKRIIFWSHLIAGVTAGLVVLSLSLTGVLLTYERQIVSWLDRTSIEGEGGRLLSAEELVVRARAVTEGRATALSFSRSPEDPVTVKLGRRESLLLDPRSGEVLEGAVGARKFFHTVTVLHRWFALEGASRDTARAVTGAANLVFLFLALSGLYLWLPRRWNWRLLKMNMLPRRHYPGAKARDYNWHHVLGFWCLIPLVVVIATGAVFSYGWANNLVYSAFGESPPVRGGPPQAEATAAGSVVSPATTLDFDSLKAVAERHDAGWTALALQLPSPGDHNVDFEIDTGTGGQPQKRTTLSLDRSSGEMVAVSGFEDNSPGRQARIFIRFLHTGEALGLWGQTLAGLASLGACILVYTGLALAYRRLVAPLLTRAMLTD